MANEIVLAEDIGDRDGSDNHHFPVAPATPNRWELSEVGPVFWSGFDQRTQEGKLSILKGMSTPDLSAESVINGTATLVNVLCHPVTVTDPKTGEVRDIVRTVLFTADGKTIGFGSEGVFKSAALLVQLWGNPPWHPGIAVRFKRVKTRQGYFTYVLDPVL